MIQAPACSHPNKASQDEIKKKSAALWISVLPQKNGAAPVWCEILYIVIISFLRSVLPLIDFCSWGYQRQTGDKRWKKTKEELKKRHPRICHFPMSPPVDWLKKTEMNEKFSTIQPLFFCRFLKNWLIHILYMQKSDKSSVSKSTQYRLRWKINWGRVEDLESSCIWTIRYYDVLSGRLLNLFILLTFIWLLIKLKDKKKSDTYRMFKNLNFK